MNKKEIISLLNLEGKEKELLFSKSANCKRKSIGNKVYLRGLIEYSNTCAKNCLYCGIRCGNKKVNRYTLSDEEVIAAANFAYENNYGSIAIQSGELSGKAFEKKIESLLIKIHQATNASLGITLSCGEQSIETYQRWKDAGAHRYLLRIESSNKELYYKIHPKDEKHNFDNRLECLHRLKNLGYQTGTGVMIGLPFQSIEHLADDLLFMKDLDIDMCGMGPFLEHQETPLYKYKSGLLPLQERYDLSLKMIAVLRLLMKDINIASATALQTINPLGRENAINVGANVIMPNITPGKYREDYFLYQNKPGVKQNVNDFVKNIESNLSIFNHTIEFGEQGNSLRYRNRK